MIKKILAALAAIGAFFTAIFYVLMKQAKTERKLEEAEAAAKDAERRANVQEAARKAENAVAKKKAALEAEGLAVSFYPIPKRRAGFQAGIPGQQPCRFILRPFQNVQ